ncbi:hypothetical protein ACHQM5_004181 [Ranunculus cassubicifolius]
MSKQPSTPPEISSSSFSVPSSSTLPNLNNSFSPNVQPYLPIKLKDATNYLLWESQFLPLLKGYSLLNHVTDPTSCPSKSLPDKDGASSTENPEYLLWFCKDQLLLSWIISSLTESPHAQIVGVDSAYAAWTTLKRLYCNQSGVNVMQLKQQLQVQKKGSLSMTDYLLKIKGITDQLASVGKVLDEDDVILHVLRGLGPEYGAFVTSITTRSTPISFTYLRGMLLSQEICLNEEQTILQNINVSANLTTSSTRPFNNRGRGRGRGRSNSRGGRG